MIRIELAVSLSYDVQPGPGADFIFNIHAAMTPHQRVVSENLLVSQGMPGEVVTDPTTASRYMRLHADPGRLNVSYQATLEIDHRFDDPATLAEVPIRFLPLDAMHYIVPSRYCQSDRLLKLAMREFGQLAPGYSRVLAIQQWVQNQVTFTSNTSNSSTSAVDTLIERVGVCRDFAHLMIALCRAANIPARIATGTDYGADPALGPPDFHAYVEVFLSGRWYIFDPSGTGIPMGFIRFGTGRDAADVAFATIFGAVMGEAPVISTVPVQPGPGFDWPEHRDEAISTAGG